MPGLTRQDLRSLGSAATRSGWAGYARLAPGEWIGVFGRFNPSDAIQSLSGSPLNEGGRDSREPEPNTQAPRNAE